MFESNAASINGMELPEHERAVKSAPGDGATSSLMRLRGVHERIFELASLGHKNIEIAQELGCTSQTVSNALRSSLGRARLAELNLERKERFQQRLERLDDMADAALSVYEDVFLGHEPLDPKDKVRFAGDILDRTGLPKTTRNEQTSVRATLSREQIEAINARAESIEIPVASVSRPVDLIEEHG